MFCYQCEQTSKGEGCLSYTVCGKSADVAILQDIIIRGLKILAKFAWRLREFNVIDPKFDALVVDGLYTTVTNVNFDFDRHVKIVHEIGRELVRAKNLYEITSQRSADNMLLVDPGVFQGSGAELIKREAMLGGGLNERGADLVGLENLVLFGLKGMAAYVHHASVFGETDPSISGFVHEILNGLSDPKSIDQLLTMALRVGEENLKAMEMLDHAHITRYGHPVPTSVRVAAVRGKAILISGHDLRDLEELLKQTAGRGVNIYTHGEMLPAHGYPGLKKYSHLVGNYGGAWQVQQSDFEKFPGAIVVTTNCIQKPRASYQDRIFTANLVGWPEVQHLSNRDFSPVIEAALRQPGFREDEPEESILVGFGRNAVLNMAETMIAAVKAGKIKHFYLIGGCDGAKAGRNYYTELAEKAPQNSIILTLACGKYRFNKKDFGFIDDIPRLLDIGQCNDAYSAIQIAMALSKAFNVGVNELPLSMILSWFEQKAVAILLTLLHLGIRNIHLGPSLPAFVTPALLNVFIDKFNLMPIKTVEEDLKPVANH